MSEEVQVVDAGFSPGVHSDQLDSLAEVRGVVYSDEVGLAVRSLGEQPLPASERRARLANPDTHYAKRTNPERVP